MDIDQETLFKKCFYLCVGYVLGLKIQVSHYCLCGCRQLNLLELYFPQLLNGNNTVYFVPQVMIKRQKLRLISLSIMFSKVLHAIACIRNSFLFIAEKKYYIVRMCHILFIHSSANGHLGCFHFWAIMNYAVNICIQAFSWRYGYISCGYIARIEFAGS